MYDQLGSLYSDQPDYQNPAIADKYLTYEYFLDEVEEVRQKLGIDNFYLIGQSWGGLLVQEYAVKYGDHLKGAIISSMVDEIDEYVAHVNQCREEVLPAEEVVFMKKCEENNDYDNDRYQQDVQVLNENFVDRKQPSRIWAVPPFITPSKGTTNSSLPVSSRTGTSATNYQRLPCQPC